MAKIIFVYLVLIVLAGGNALELLIHLSPEISRGC